jgi:hypothetical protein
MRCAVRAILLKIIMRNLHMYAVPIIPHRGFGRWREIEGLVFPAVLNDSLLDASN